MKRPLKWKRIISHEEYDLDDCYGIHKLTICSGCKNKYIAAIIDVNYDLQVKRFDFNGQSFRGSKIISEDGYESAESIWNDNVIASGREKALYSIDLKHPILQKHPHSNKVDNFKSYYPTQITGVLSDNKLMFYNNGLKSQILTLDGLSNFSFLSENLVSTLSFGNSLAVFDRRKLKVAVASRNVLSNDLSTSKKFNKYTRTFENRVLGHSANIFGLESYKNSTLVTYGTDSLIGFWTFLGENIEMKRFRSTPFQRIDSLSISQNMNTLFCLDTSGNFRSLFLGEVFSPFSLEKEDTKLFDLAKLSSQVVVCDKFGKLTFMEYH